MATGDSRVTKTIGLSLKKGTYQNKPPKDESYIIKDSDGTLKEFKDDGTKVALGSGGGGTVASVVAGTGISVNATDPANPIVTNSRGVDPGTLVTLLADTQAWDFATGLTDADGDYHVRINLVCDVSGRVYLLQPNGANPTASNGTYFYSTTGTLTGNVNQANSMLVGISNTGVTCEIDLWIECKSGRVRMIHGGFFTDTSTAANNIPGWFRYMWNDTATVLTKLTLFGPAAATIKATSTARIQKLGFLA